MGKQSRLTATPPSDFGNVGRLHSNLPVFYVDDSSYRSFSISMFSPVRAATAPWAASAESDDVAAATCCRPRGMHRPRLMGIFGLSVLVPWEEHQHLNCCGVGVAGGVVQGGGVDFSGAGCHPGMPATRRKDPVRSIPYEAYLEDVWKPGCAPCRSLVHQKKFRTPRYPDPRRYTT